MPPALPRYVSSSATLTGVRWRRSSHSTAANNCVEAALVPSARLLAVRDSKDREGPALLFMPAAWDDFLRAVTAGTLAARG
jgi:hypothetical protein